MRIAFYALLTFSLMATAWLLLAGREREDESHDDSQRATPGATAAMRDNLLAGSAAEFGITPVGFVWGVLMEIGFPDAWASLVTLADGSASLYTSKGGGVIGGGGHESVRRAAMNVCAVAAPLGAFSEKVTEFPHPGAGRIRFYVLTMDGVRTAEDSAEALRSKDHPLNSLFVAADQAMTELRQASQRANSGRPSPR